MLSSQQALLGKVVWITGASSGIGEALAYELAKQGAKLVLSARRLDQLERVKNGCLNSEQHRVEVIDLELSDGFDEQVTQLIGETGGIDLLINNAGLSQRSFVMDTNLAVHRRLMEINYFGTVKLTQSLLPHMLQRGSGGVITVISMVGKFTTPMRCAYAASKHAITAYMDSLRAELDGQGLQFTSIYPGFIKTNLTYQALLGDGSEQNKMDDAQQNGMSAKQCAKQIVKSYQKGKVEVFIGGKEKWAVYLKRFLPKLFAKIIKKAKVT